MHSGKEHSRDRKDPRVVEIYDSHNFKQKKTLEYEGLHQGELAWILGRRFNGSESVDHGAVLYRQQAYAGLGNGVDRMQRLASTSWMIAMMHQKNTKKIDLESIALGTDQQAQFCSLIAEHRHRICAGTVLFCPDPIHSEFTGVRGADFTPAVEDTFKPPLNKSNSGLFCLETGPFLRGMQVDTHNVPLDDLKKFGHVLPRNLGDMCVMSAIETEMRKNNLMDWTPDGVVLSKLDSPTGEPLKSMELDAREAQLFNVAVQGPAITTAWTSDVKGENASKLVVQPDDKVFICLVADLVWNSRDVNGDVPHDDLYDRAKEVHQPANNLEQQVQLAKNMAKDYITACKDKNNARDEIDELCKSKQRLKDAKKFELRLTDIEGWFTAKTELAALQQQFRNGTKQFASASLTNFRLVRETSSHMINYSYWDPERHDSRCGLKFGRYTEMGGARLQGVAEYIVGGWCIGTVMDSAASRSTVGTLVRTAPSSMAININVNVEWWSSNKLYQHFMDKSGWTRMRNQQPPWNDIDLGKLSKKQRTDLDPVDKDIRKA